MKFFPIRIFTVLQATEAIDLYKSVGFVSEDLTRKIEQGFGKRSNNVEMHMNNQISKWRPDIRNPISSESSEITSFRTNFTKQLDDLAKNVDREIANTEAAVKEIKEALKRSIGKFNWSSEKSSKGAAWENETYYNAGYVNTDEDDKYSSLRNMTISNMQQDKCFANGEIDVSFDQSAVHVPFNVYSLSTEVVRGATYTKELDQNFYQNIRKGRVSSWQYFASSSGFTRFYPTPQWKRKDEFDRPIDYDARFEHWYIGTINYPKEVVIALDASGSMKGKRFIVSSGS